MKTLTYTKDHDLSQLAGELIAAVPGLITIRSDGQRESVFQLSGDGSEITITVSDEASTATIAAVVNAHTIRPRGVALSDDAVRPIVTGSRSNGAAMASLLRRLARAGLIEDQTTP